MVSSVEVFWDGKISCVKNILQLKSRRVVDIEWFGNKKLDLGLAYIWSHYFLQAHKSREAWLNFYIHIFRINYFRTASFSLFSFGFLRTTLNGWREKFKIFLAFSLHHSNLTPQTKFQLPMTTGCTNFHERSVKQKSQTLNTNNLWSELKEAGTLYVIVYLFSLPRFLELFFPICLTHPLQIYGRIKSTARYLL